MIETFISPAKKNPGISGKAFVIVLVLAILVFQSTNATAANELILDNGEAGTSSTERWKRWNSGKDKGNPYGKNSLYTYSARATYTYNLDLPSAGEYQVFAWWSASSIHSTSVPYDITHLSGTSTVTVNQQKNGGQWNRLGATWNFDKTATITIRPKGIGTVIADAIMLVPVETNTNVDTAPVNTAPVISGTPAGSVTANEGYSFQPSASDADGDQLTFSISNKPAWASLSTSSGRLSGTPTDNHVNTYSGIVISVSDGADAASLPSFGIQVAAAPVVNTAPVISGTPAGSVTANEGYSFQPSASDADGDQLTFSISNKPAWASFSTSSGRLSGTPTDNHVNTYSGIVISVSDGADAASLPSFGIQVAAAPVLTGGFSVSWTAPVTRTDGESLSLADISGYRIYSGGSSGTYTDFAEVKNGTATSWAVTNVPVGTRYVVMTTYDSEGRESDYSREVSKIVQ